MILLGHNLVSLKVYHLHDNNNVLIVISTTIFIYHEMHVQT